MLHFELLSLLSSVSQCRRQRRRERAIERGMGVLGVPCHFLSHIPGPLKTLTYQKQDGFLYCHPFHLKCKWILTRCGLTEIKAGVLTFSGRVFWGREEGGAEAGVQGEEGEGGVVLLFSSPLLEYFNSPFWQMSLSLALCSQCVRWCRWRGARPHVQSRVEVCVSTLRWAALAFLKQTLVFQTVDIHRLRICWAQYAN